MESRARGLDNHIGGKFCIGGFGGSSSQRNATGEDRADNDVQLRVVEAVLGVNDTPNDGAKVANAAGNLRGKRSPAG